MKKAEPNTEEKIKAAARKMFMLKGYNGVTSRDIAKEAGLNVALTNYYFRKKEKLFKIIYMDVVHEFLDDSIEILNKPIDLKIKIRLILERVLETTKKNPDFYLFFYSEIKNSSDEFLKELGHVKDRMREKWNEQIHKSIKEKVIRKIDPLAALTIVMGQLQFPIIASRILKELGEFTEKGYADFLEDQKEHAVEMINNYLFLKRK
ncbi:MAG TPA: TetR/AcrR family transcriptional regulator [Ignavibacteria bacterium]|nr:TetR/AcrR family transcriptional regulator [Ignavibacteria bacterium]